MHVGRVVGGILDGPDVATAPAQPHEGDDVGRHAREAEVESQGVVAVEPTQPHEGVGGPAAEHAAPVVPEGSGTARARPSRRSGWRGRRPGWRPASTNRCSRRPTAAIASAGSHSSSAVCGEPGKVPGGSALSAGAAASASDVGRSRPLDGASRPVAADRRPPARRRITQGRLADESSLVHGWKALRRPVPCRPVFTASVRGTRRRWLSSQDTRRGSAIAGREGTPL